MRFEQNVYDIKASVAVHVNVLWAKMRLESFFSFLVCFLSEVERKEKHEEKINGNSFFCAGVWCNTDNSVHPVSVLVPRSRQTKTITNINRKKTKRKRKTSTVRIRSFFFANLGQENCVNGFRAKVKGKEKLVFFLLRTTLGKRKRKIIKAN